MSDLGLLLLFANPATMTCFAGLACLAYSVLMFYKVKTDSEKKQKGLHIGGGIALLIVAFAIFYGAFQIK